MRLGLILLLLSLLFLAACGEEKNTNVPLPTTSPINTPTPLPTDTLRPGTPLTPLPTFTPFRTPITPTPSPSPIPILPTFTPIPNGPSLDYIARAPISFRNAYNQAISRGFTPDPEVKLVLAQTNQLTPDRAVWQLYFVKSSTNKMWAITLDSQGGFISDDKQKPILATDSGLIDPAKVLDTPALIQKLGTLGFPPPTPVDTLILQVYTLPDKRRVPAWYLINTVYNRQLVVNAYSGDIIENSFNR
jgi:hypothetical protein